jgi:hypothetical protein
VGNCYSCISLRPQKQQLLKIGAKRHKKNCLQIVLYSTIYLNNPCFMLNYTKRLVLDSVPCRKTHDNIICSLNITITRSCDPPHATTFTTITQK